MLGHPVSLPKTVLVLADFLQLSMVSRLVEPMESCKHMLELRGLHNDLQTPDAEALQRVLARSCEYHARMHDRCLHGLCSY